MSMPTNGTDLFLVRFGHFPAADLNPSVPLYPATGLVLPLPITDGGTVNMVIATPADLMGFADLAAVSLMKPVCLPLDLIRIQPGRIDARLATHDRARALAERVLAALARPRHPAPRGPDQ